MVDHGNREGPTSRSQWSDRRIAARALQEAANGRLFARRERGIMDGPRGQEERAARADDPSRIENCLRDSHETPVSG